MKVVSRLVGLDANERRPRFVDREVEIVERNIRYRRGKRLLCFGIKVLPERPAAADLVLPQARLRLVNPERAKRAQGRTEMFGGQSLVVDAVAGFMKHAEKCLVEEARVVAGGDAAIARPNAGTERVGRDVESARLEIKADRLGGGTSEGRLSIDRIFPFQ